jgi:hypothetical protein
LREFFISRCLSRRREARQGRAFRKPSEAEKEGTGQDVRPGIGIEAISFGDEAELLRKRSGCRGIETPRKMGDKALSGERKSEVLCV